MIKFAIVVRPIDVADRLFESAVNCLHEIQLINADDGQGVVDVRNCRFTDADTGTSGDSTRLISTTFWSPTLSAAFKYAAAVQPAEPPPTINTRLVRMSGTSRIFVEVGINNRHQKLRLFWKVPIRRWYQSKGC